MELEGCMKAAIKEAEESLREGNNGFGAVIFMDGEIIAKAHDREDTDNDPTSHAEANAIRAACGKLGKKLAGCILVATHEPCPMCATATVWAGITEIAYGHSIKDARMQGRNRLDFPCAEVFEREGARVKIHAGLLREECGVLYRKDVRTEIERLRDAGDDSLKALSEDSARKRTAWFHENREGFDFISDDLPESAYRLLLKRLRIGPEEAPVTEKTKNCIVFHSVNFCPTLEACRILGLDTREICRKLNEASTDTLIKQLDGRLRFSRNYDKLRPYAEYCEETISLSEEK